MWLCPKCNKSYGDYLARYILYVKLSDDTLSDYATIFNDAGTKLLGKEANEIRQMRENNNDPELDFIFESVIQRRYNFTIKATEESYQDDLRVKFTVQSLEPIAYLDESKNMIERISQLLAKNNST